MIMNEEKAREILGDHITPQGDLCAGSGGNYAYISWSIGDGIASLDDEFTAEELEAIAWWMKEAEGKVINEEK